MKHQPDLRRLKFTIQKSYIIPVAHVKDNLSVSCYVIASRKDIHLPYFLP